MVGSRSLDLDVTAQISPYPFDLNDLIETVDGGSDGRGSMTKPGRRDLAGGGDGGGAGIGFGRTGRF